jgi:hypothetical protein
MHCRRVAGSHKVQTKVEAILIITTPEDLNAHYNDLFRLGDIEALVEL